MPSPAVSRRGFDRLQTLPPMLDYSLDIWDYLTFAVLLAAIVVAMAAFVWIAGLPGRIAIQRKHPDAEAFKLMGYAGFLQVMPWIKALIWVFK